jgi:Microsomal signal peptidase 25 kDa subunit (SPC25)
MDGILKALGLKSPSAEETEEGKLSRVDVTDEAGVKRAVDDAVCHVVSSLGFGESVWLSHVRLALMVCAVAVGAAAHVFPRNPPEGAAELGVYVVAYFALAGLLQVLAWWEGDTLLYLRESSVPLPATGAALAEANAASARDAQQGGDEGAGVGGWLGGVCGGLRGFCERLCPSGENEVCAELAAAGVARETLPALQIRSSMQKHEDEYVLVAEWRRDGRTDRAMFRCSYGRFFTAKGLLAYSAVADAVVQLLRKVPPVGAPARRDGTRSEEAEAAAVIQTAFRKSSATRSAKKQD